MRALLALLLLPIVVVAQPTDSSIPRIAVSGTGHAVAQPTRAVVSFAVEGTERTASEAFAEVARQTEAVLTALRRLHLRGEQLQVAVLTIAPDRRRDDRHTAQRRVTARVDTLSKLPAILSAILDTGVEAVQGVRYEAEDPDTLQRRALDMAMAEARVTAERLAAQAGSTLGPALHIESHAQSGVSPVSYFRTDQVRYDEVRVGGSAGGAAGGYAFGTVGVSAQVRVTFRLDTPEVAPAPE